MRIFNKDIKLAIFDLDGTLIDSTSIWAEIDEKFFAKHGLEIPPSYNEEIAHIGLTKAAELTSKKYLPKEKPEDILKEWMNFCYEAYATSIPLKKDAEKLLKLLKDNGVHIALATANSKEIYEVALHRLDIHQYFDCILDVNSCKEGKNSPEIYDKACETFKVNRGETIIFEDMITPLTTAYDSGFIVIAMEDHASRKDIERIKKKSHLLIQNFGQIIELIKF